MSPSVRRLAGCAAMYMVWACSSSPADTETPVMATVAPSSTTSESVTPTPAASSAEMEMEQVQSPGNDGVVLSPPEQPPVPLQPTPSSPMPALPELPADVMEEVDDGAETDVGSEAPASDAGPSDTPPPEASGNAGPDASTPAMEPPQPPPQPAPGQILVDDLVPGYASIAGGTSGGGTDLATAITVTSMSELQNAASGSQPALILVQPGDYNGTLSPGANKTIIGVAPGVTIHGNINISGNDRSNIIIRNLAVQGLRCNSYDECKEGSDGVYIGNGAHHVWLDHLDVSDGQDGNCDVTRGGDFVTISWTHFHYTYEKEHRFSNLIAGSDDEPESVGKLQITYMACHWGQLVDSRQPRGRFGNIHMLNNYHNTGGTQIHGVGKDMALIAENSVYEENRSIWTDMGEPRGWLGSGNIGSGQDLDGSFGTVFEVPYEYTALPASEVVSAVTAAQCGAGNTCTLGGL